MTGVKKQKTARRDGKDYNDDDDPFDHNK
jgi:hypothetical protein